MCDELYGELDALSRRLEPLMTKLAKACLTSKPDDLDKFCYDFFAARVAANHSAEAPRGEGAKSSSARATPQQNGGDASAFLDEDELDDDEGASEAEADYTAAIVRTKSRKVIVRKTNYESSDDDDEHAGSPVSQAPAEKSAEPGAVATATKAAGEGHNGAKGSWSGSAAGCGDNSDDDVIDDEEIANYKAISRVKSMKPDKLTLEDLEIDTCEKKKAEVARIIKIADEAKSDPRMKKLFDTWDADGGGTVDLVELVVAMHKFNRVMEDGSGLKRATEALLHNDDDESQELDIAEFARFVVTFCEEAYGKTFDEMAAHMLAVAGSSSERAALAVASGHRDVEQIIKDDEKEIEVLKETVRGVEASVVENISKIKTSRKVMFQ